MSSQRGIPSLILCSANLGQHGRRSLPDAAIEIVRGSEKPEITISCSRVTHRDLLRTHDLSQIPQVG